MPVKRPHWIDSRYDRVASPDYAFRRMVDVHEAAILFQMLGDIGTMVALEEALELLAVQRRLRPGYRRLAWWGGHYMILALAMLAIGCFTTEHDAIKFALIAGALVGIAAIDASVFLCIKRPWNDARAQAKLDAQAVRCLGDITSRSDFIPRPLRSDLRRELDRLILLDRLKSAPPGLL